LRGAADGSLASISGELREEELRMSEQPGFAINGRFLTQPVTGVQRYARNTILALDDALQSAGVSAPIIAPPGAPDPALMAMPLVRAGSASGQVWEQVSLPRAWPGRLLNLCNMAPALKRDQVVCIHDANVFEAPDSYGRAFRTAYRALLPAIARRSTRLATVSQASARSLAHHLGVAASGIAVLPNGHEHALAWDGSRSALGASEAFGMERPFVLAIGSRARHKNMQLLADIAPDLDAAGIDVVIAGGGGGLFADDQLRAAPNMHMAGRVSDDDLAYLLDRALCLAFPSWTEGFGLPLVEAMARGCPVVSSDRASMPEICGSAALMASPAEPDAWLRHIRRLRDERGLRDDLIASGRERARLFSWSATAAGYLELMREPTRRLTRPPEAAAHQVRAAVVVATLGRPDVVTASVRYLLATQTLQPDCVIVSCAAPGDAGSLAEDPRVKVVTGPKGLPNQRNTAIAALPPGIDLVAFFDDDFVADKDWLAAAARAFASDPGVVGLTGWVLADGIKGPGIGFDEAVSTVEGNTSASHERWIEPYSPYGCNMAFRASSIGELRFDQRLVLYGWLEDRDFAATLAREGGRLVKSAEARGVHMGVKGGRVHGDRLGYSQVINPIYMLRKGTMTTLQVADHIARNVASNLAKALRPEPFIDRRGRLRGNVLALADLMRGRIEPERAASIQPRRGDR
jgi:glycosyltransferase involved in cell wall biosynthesis/GT2 family glycosyltransferase